MASGPVALWENMTNGVVRVPLDSVTLEVRVLQNMRTGEGVGLSSPAAMATRYTGVCGRVGIFLANLAPNALMVTGTDRHLNHKERQL